MMNNTKQPIPENKIIIRVDKSDGSESIEHDLSCVTQLIHENYLGNPLRKIEHFLAGALRVQSDFAYYELRDVEVSK